LGITKAAAVSCASLAKVSLLRPFVPEEPQGIAEDAYLDSRETKILERYEGMDNQSQEHVQAGKKPN
jgi:hypothetical protein